jgi:hypothetical protein
MKMTKKMKTTKMMKKTKKKIKGDQQVPLLVLLEEDLHV